MRNRVHLIAPTTLLLLLAACGTLPRSGPSRGDMLAAGDQHIAAVIELDAATVGTLATVASPTLTGTFGNTQPAREQRIGIGDAVRITIWEAGPGGLFSSPVTEASPTGSRSATIPEQTVAQDGAITVPFAGRVPVVGRTPPDIERVIVERLADKAIDPQALLTVTRNVSNTATVVSEATAGALVPLSVRGDRLLDAVASAGGVRTPLQDTAVALTRGTQTVRVPMQALLDNPRENVFLQPGDVVTLVRDPQTFTVAGATGRSALVPFETRDLMLDEAIAKGGGLLDDRAAPDGLFVIRYETENVARALPQATNVIRQPAGVPAIYHLNMRDPAALFVAHSFAMRNKDVVYVANAPLSELQKVLTLINLLVTPAVTGATVQSVVK